MSWPHVGWDIEAGCGTLTLRRPPLNILNLEMLRELEQALGGIAADPSVRVVILRAEGRVFSAGVDVGDHLPDKVGEMIPLFDRVCRALWELPAVTLAVIHGDALGGGCEQVMGCDLAVASESARLGQPEIRLAALAPVAAMLLPRLVGERRAAELLLTGGVIGAAEAARIGLVNEAVPTDQLQAAVARRADVLLTLSGKALRLNKRALRLGMAGWQAEAAMERLYLDELMATDDAREGVAAFLEKRAPVWRDR